MTHSQSTPSSSIDWSKEPEIDPQKEYRALIRSIQYTQGFGLLFVRCAPVEAERLIKRVQEDFGRNQPASTQGKTIEVLRLQDPIDNLYEIVAALPNKDQIDILFITGIEKSLISDIKPGYQGEGEYYNLNTLPRILGHLNLQRERFRDDFDICFIFLVPLFALKYFTRRAPDFFDWRSGVWEFGTNSHLLRQESLRILQDRSFEKYLALSTQERNQRILEIQELIDVLHVTVDKEADLFLELGHLLDNKADLFLELGRLFAIGADYPSAIASYGKALAIKPDKNEAWYNRGIALGKLGRLEEAISSFDKALEFKPDLDQAWNNRGSTLANLERFEDAIFSFDKALELKPENPNTFYNKACCYALQANSEAAVENLKLAISQEPEEYREMAKTDSDFDSIRDQEAFQALLTSAD